MGVPVCAASLAFSVCFFRRTVLESSRGKTKRGANLHSESHGQGGFCPSVLAAGPLSNIETFEERPSVGTDDESLRSSQQRHIPAINVGPKLTIDGVLFCVLGDLVEDDSKLGKPEKESQETN